MSTDFALLVANLRRFYDFTGKEVLFVGAGGGQLLDPAVRPARGIAIDPDREALEVLRRKVAALRLDSFEYLASPFDEVTRRGDVVYFEFCLHEMANPAHALTHARTLAPEVVVFDHAAGSPWVYYAAEDEMIRRSSEAIQRFGVRRSFDFSAQQEFKDHAELLAKLAPQGSAAVARAAEFAGRANIVIPMPCMLALL